MRLEARFAHALIGARGDYDRLLEAIGDARFVLLGEASHGTHEFYLERARITRRLIEEKGFNAVAAEADWPDAWRVSRWLAGRGQDRSAEAALSGFRRFPHWMWRNVVVRDFLDWLRGRNAGTGSRTGFYGLDLYSLFGSIAEVLAYLDRTDSEAARHARSRYACFDHFEEDSQAYGYAAAFGQRTWRRETAPRASSCGRTTRTSATPARPRWAKAASSTTGMRRRGTSASDRACREATRTFSIRPRPRASW